MPVQRSLFGRPVGLVIPPRRFLLLAGTLLVVVFMLTLGPPKPAELPTYEQISDAVKHPHVPNLPKLPTPEIPKLPSVPNPFQSAHKPPVQANSTASSIYRTIEWLSDFKWRNPFSTAITLDENRAVLPPLPDRPPIYTFYEPKGKQDKAVSEAEHRLILAWRRAWWAKGFKPQVLSRAEASRHPQYDFVQRMKLDPKVELEVMRWLSWGQMGGGILAKWLVLPMAKHEDSLLEFLRRKEYPKISRVESLGDGMFFGEAKAVNDAINKATKNELLKDVKANTEKIADLAKKPGGALVGLLTPADVSVQTKVDSIAYYSVDTISKEYKTVAEKLTNSTQTEGLALLAELINSHLHLTFQETYSDGIGIVKPLPEHTTALMYEAIDIGRNLTQCPSTPMPKSCPPNRPKCTPCVANKAPKLHLLTSYSNSSTLYSIGTVPHPYTLNTLHYTRDRLDSNFLRNNAKRNMWLYALTNDTLGDSHTEQFRVISFKDIVAAPSSASHSLWLTAERVSQADLDWIFGFSLPQASSDAPPSSPAAPPELALFPRPGMPRPLEGVEIPEEKWIKKEEERLANSRDALRSKDKDVKEVIKMVEEWNLADTEAWKFARSFSARRRVEREVWEQEEKKYAGSEKKAGVGRGRGGWFDRR